MHYISTLMVLIFIAYAQCELCNHHYIKQFPKFAPTTNEQEQIAFNNINEEEWTKFIRNGYDSTQKFKNFDRILSNSRIIVQNGTVSHIQLLDVMPDNNTQNDSDIAATILTISSHIHHSKCSELGIGSKNCATLLSTKQLPKNTELHHQCVKAVENRNGLHTFRRLLPRKYYDNFHMMSQMIEEKSTPLHISQVMSSELRNTLPKSDDISAKRNLALVQWTQFIEHDLSKPVATSLSNGKAIECCNPDNYNLQPRYRHSACAPLLKKDPTNIYATEICLNYVRSALGVNTDCTFAPLDQLNQATAMLDLSQLYGFTPNMQQLMRTFKNGRIVSSNVEDGNIKTDMPSNIVSKDSVHFCTWNTNSSQSNCLMAGDMRINSNPLTIAIYTLFLRNHNRLAAKLQQQHPNLSDEILFNTARAANIKVYRRIVFNEWFPAVVGLTFDNFKSCTLNKNNLNYQVLKNDFQISNEFAIAVIRFYYTMMPDFVRILSTLKNKKTFGETIQLTLSKFLVFTDPAHRSNTNISAETLNLIQQSTLQQSAMEADIVYESAFVMKQNHTNHILNMDALAFDIQRGRDHGLQGYVKYAEICNNIRVTDWKDLETLIGINSIEMLKKTYNNVNDVDLIIGGLLENAIKGSIVGPTFTCIIGEQFLKIEEWEYQFESDNLRNEIDGFTMKLWHLLCLNYELSLAPQNIYFVPSDKYVKKRYTT